jgi:hypothetical protein
VRQAVFLMRQLTHGAYNLCVLPEILCVKYEVTQLNGNAGRDHAERHAITSGYTTFKMPRAASPPAWMAQ